MHRRGSQRDLRLFVSGEEVGLHLRRLVGVCDTKVAALDRYRKHHIDLAKTYAACRREILQLLSLVGSVAAAGVCHCSGVLSILR